MEMGRRAPAFRPAVAGEVGGSGGMMSETHREIMIDCVLYMYIHKVVAAVNRLHRRQWSTDTVHVHTHTCYCTCILHFLCPP